jgi:hypothetical protein
MKTDDPIKLLAAANPLSEDGVAALAEGMERELIRARIDARRRPAPPRYLRRSSRVAAIAGAVAVLLAIPALALSGVLGGAFDFSNNGQTVPQSGIGLTSAKALDLTGVKAGTLKLLAARQGVGIYAARSTSGNLCYFVGAPKPDSRGLGGGCLNATASAAFPSPAQPLIDMSGFMYTPGAHGETVRRLAGIAADGVATIQLLDRACQPITEAPVRDNVYIDANVPDTPAVAIRALDGSGKRVYLEKLRFWTESSCATAR